VKAGLDIGNLISKLLCWFPTETVLLFMKARSDVRKLKAIAIASSSVSVFDWLRPTVYSVNTHAMSVCGRH